MIRFPRRAFPTLLMFCAASAVQAEPPPLSAYGDLPEVEDSAISPSGEGLAVVMRANGQRQLLLFDGQRALRFGAALGDLKLRGLRWVGEDHVLMIKSDTQALNSNFTTDKMEFSTAAFVPKAGGKVVTVFADRPGMVHAVFGNYGTRLVDGRWQTFFGGVEYARAADTGSHVSTYKFDNGRPALFSVDPRGGVPRKVAPSAAENHWRSWLVDGAGVAAATLDVDAGSGRWTIKNARGAELAEGLDLSGNVDLISLGKDGTTLIYSQFDKAAEQTRWFEVPLAGGAASEVLAGIDITKLFVDPTNGRLLGYAEQGNEGKPVLYDPAQQAALRKIYRAFPKLHVSIEGWTPDFGHVVFRTGGNGDSGTWYVVAMATLKAMSIGEERPAIPAAQVGPISTVSYKAADGLQLDGVLTLPPGKEAKNLPVIMLPHGGPHAHDAATFDWWAQAFASRGYAVFQPNFRGSTNRDQAFVRAGYGQWGRKMQTDISDGLAELARQGVVDPKRACIVGASYGGYAALAGVTLQRGLYRCAVAVAPVSDLSDMFWTEYRESGRSEMRKRNMRESLGNPSSFGEVSPRRSAAKADAPILLIHGKDDTVVPFKQSTAMADALKDAGKPYELVTLPGEDHWLSRSATRQQMLEAAVGFVQKNNPAN